MKKIIVNDQLREFVDPDSYLIQKYDENLKARNTECCGLRQTGRTTRMVVKSVQSVVENPQTRIIIVAHNMGMVTRILGLINHYKYQLDVQIPGESINVIPKSSMDPRGVKKGEILLYDNGVTDCSEEEK